MGTIETIKKYIADVRTYAASQSGKEVLIGLSVVICLVALVVVAVVFIQNSGTKIVYQPAVACELFTEDEAKEMLGQQVLHQTPANPTLQSNVATSKCSYTDVNPEQDQMIVAAVAIRSAVNDKGAEKNELEFTAASTAKNVEIVKNIGDSAFFNPQLGQLNILKDRDWVIVSYGVGSDPKSNPLDKAIELAQKVIFDSQLPTF